MAFLCKALYGGGLPCDPKGPLFRTIGRGTAADPNEQAR
jgi:hypothetical protein